MRFARAIALALAAALFGGGSAHASESPTAPLGHDGRWITDADGRVVVLHGFNVVPKGEPALASDRGFGTDDADFLASHGFNTVRLGVDYSELEPEPGSYDNSFVDAWVGQVPMLAERGIFTLLDLHQDQFGPKYKGNGLPDWMGIDNGFPNTGEGFPMGYLQNPALNRAFDNFWANASAPDGIGLQDHYAEGLRRVAAAADGEPGLLGYDLFNEPWPGSQYPTCANPAGCPAFDAALLRQFSLRAIAAIRAEDEDGLAFYEPNLIFDFGAVTHHGDTGDSAAAMSFHDYCLPGAFMPGSPLEGACETEEDLVFQNAETQATLTGDGLLLTEFGATDDPRILERVARLADRHMVGWQEWTYANYFDGGQSEHQSLVRDTTLPPTGENVDQGKLEALVRPYPRVVAGTPEEWSFRRAEGSFDAVWTTTLPGGGAAGDALSEVFVPALQYPDGYAATIQGGEVVAGLLTQSLSIRACPGAQTVTLGVERAAGRPPKTCSEQGGGTDPPPPGGEDVPCPPGNSPTVRCARTTDAFGRNVLQVVGTARPEQLAGSNGRDVLVCGGGADRARARRGSDRIGCGRKADRLTGGRGPDTLGGGKGADTLKGGPGRDRISCGPGRDVARFAARDHVAANCD